MPNYTLTQLDSLPPIPCPCGSARRGFADLPGGPASVHLVDVKREAKAHYHKATTEIYIVLEGEGFVELDGERVAVKPMSAIMIRPGCVHRAVGNLRILNIPIPAFDPADEWIVEDD